MYALLAQTLFSIAVPMVLQGDVKVGKIEGDMEYTSSFAFRKQVLGNVILDGVRINPTEFFGCFSPQKFSHWNNQI